MKLKVALSFFIFLAAGSLLSPIFASRVSLLQAQGETLHLEDRTVHMNERAKLEGACLHCHADRSRMQTDISKPECQECHGSQPSVPDYPVRVAQPSGQKIVEQKMVLIPEGPFKMGNNGRPAAEGSGDEDEQPVHQVFVKAFYMDLYETTNAQYKRYFDAVQAEPPIHWRKGTYPPDKANHPVVYVSWHDANAYCQWNGKRLPTEEEWEKAARGTDQRHFPWGVQYDVKKANTPQHWLAKGVEVRKGSTMPVGSFEDGKSPYGLYDMAGNVYEWTGSWYLPYPGNQVPNIHYGNKNRVLRGGSWYDCLSYGCGLSSPVYNRSRFTPEIKNKGFGFRCASDTKK